MFVSKKALPRRTFLRAILRGAEPSRYTLSSLVLGVVKSRPFQLREPS